MGLLLVVLSCVTSPLNGTGPDRLSLCRGGNRQQRLMRPDEVGAVVHDHLYQFLCERRVILARQRDEDGKAELLKAMEVCIYHTLVVGLLIGGYLRIDIARTWIEDDLRDTSAGRAFKRLLE